MTDKREKRVLSKLDIIEVSEVSSVGKPANRLIGFDIIKGEQDIDLESIKKSIEEYLFRTHLPVCP